MNPELQSLKKSINEPDNLAAINAGASSPNLGQRSPRAAGSVLTEQEVTEREKRDDTKLTDKRSKLDVLQKQSPPEDQ